MNPSILQRLQQAQVEFVLVGAAAALTQGVPVTTLDVDIVHSREPANLDRLHGLLIALDAHYRGRPADQKLAPTRAHLDTSGHLLLRTALGPLDVLGAIENGADFAWLKARSDTIAYANNTLWVPTLETLIELKRHGTRPEDPLKLRLMEETLRIRRERESK